MIAQPTNRVSEYAQQCADETRYMMDEYPLASVLVAFGVGVAAGVALVSLMPESSDWRHRSMAQRLGSQVLEAMTNVMPESLSKSFRH